MVVLTKTYQRMNSVDNFVVACAYHKLLQVITTPSQEKVYSDSTVWR